jgi:hypothetical protein
MGGKLMRRSLAIALMVVLSLSAMAVMITGCGRGKASGKLQIMYSGNIRGNVVPCG